MAIMLSECTVVGKLLKFCFVQFMFIFLLAIIVVVVIKCVAQYLF